MGAGRRFNKFRFYMFSIEFLVGQRENFSLWHFNVFQVNCKPRKPPVPHTKPLPFARRPRHQLDEYLSHFYENNVLKILSKNFQIMFGFSGGRTLNLLLLFSLLPVCLCSVPKVCHFSSLINAYLEANLMS